MAEFIFERYNYWAIILLMMVGLYVTFQAGNMIKRMVGLSVFQTSVFLFYVTLGKISGGSAPILFGRDYPKDHGGHGEGDHGGGHGAEAGHGAADAGHGEAGDHGAADHAEQAVDELGRPFVDGHIEPGHVGGEPLQEIYSNPLPHVLILTAIVVGVATLAVGLAIIVRIRESYGTIEIDELREKDIEHAETEASAEPA
ncbi:MAG: NADH-quinone oxidoreductase [Ponticaulis sp.]|nr:NADH-quinone oxidoreductase [Ponticaulis sp.]|tara:strand:+ start:8324 stop:8920 length:597 start_codon:yes stop_codon:yes gene_type:complete